MKAFSAIDQPRLQARILAPSEVDIEGSRFHLFGHERQVPSFVHEDRIFHGLVAHTEHRDKSTSTTVRKHAHGAVPIPQRQVLERVRHQVHLELVLAEIPAEAIERELVVVVLVVVAHPACCLAAFSFSSCKSQSAICIVWNLALERQLQRSREHTSEM